MGKNFEEKAQEMLDKLCGNCYVHKDQLTEDAFKEGYRAACVTERNEVIHEADDWIYWNASKFLFKDQYGVVHLNDVDLSEELRKHLMKL